MVMERFVWNSEKYSVGHDLIDHHHHHHHHHHQKLMDIVNVLIELSEQEVPKKADYLQTLLKMSDYSHYHFRAEEGLLATSNYAQLKTQQEEHQAFSEKASLLVTECDLRQLDETTRFLRRWLEHHILEEDMKFKTALS
jgi:hemerythrin